MYANWQYHTFTIITSLLALFLLHRSLLADRSRGRPRCPKCWYDLRAANQSTFPLACPECGRIIHKRRHLHRTRRRWLPLIISLCLIVCAWYSTEVRWRTQSLGEPWRTALAPSTVLIVIAPYHDTSRRLIFQRAYRFSPNAFTRQDSLHLWWWQQWLLTRTATDILTQPHQLIPARQEAVQLLVHSRFIGPAQIDVLLATIDSPDMTCRLSASFAIRSLKPRFFADVSDAQLIEMLDRSLAFNRYWAVDEWKTVRDVLLAEVVARNTPMLRSWLERTWQTMHDNQTATDWRSLSILTALRRCRGEPEPLSLEFVDDPPRTATADRLPVVFVTVVNRDMDRSSLQFLHPGFDHLQHFRAVVRRADTGAPADIPKRKTPGIIGRISASLPGFRPMPYGSSVRYRIDMNNFAQGIAPGEYVVTLQYHNVLPIKGSKSVETLIVTTSPPFHLTIR